MNDARHRLAITGPGSHHIRELQPIIHKLLFQGTLCSSDCQGRRQKNATGRWKNQTNCDMHWHHVTAPVHRPSGTHPWWAMSLATAKGKKRIAGSRNSASLMYCFVLAEKYKISDASTTLIPIVIWYEPQGTSAYYAPKKYNDNISVSKRLYIDNYNIRQGKYCIICDIEDIHVLLYSNLFPG